MGFPSLMYLQEQLHGVSRCESRQICRGYRLAMRIFNGKSLTRKYLILEKNFKVMDNNTRYGAIR